MAADYTPVLKKKTLTLTKQNKTKKMTVKAGTIIRLKVKYKKKKVSSSKIKFSSSKKKVASVSADGVITTKKAGKAVIKLKRKKKKQYATLNLLVLPRDPIIEVDPDDIAEDEKEADKDIICLKPAEAYAAQNSAICEKHTHKWEAVNVENYPAEYCTVCGIERWLGSDELKKEATVSTSRKFIMIGDSYGARSPSWGGNYTWPYLLCKELGLGKGQAYICAKGGYGFGAQSVGSTRFFTDLLRTVEPDPKVTDILIVGGIGNDLGRTKQEIQNGFIQITMEAYARFPNARIIYAAPNCHISNTAWQDKLDMRRPWYKSFCMIYGWLYLDGCETILPREAPYFRADGHHPNENGETVLGEGLLKKLKVFL